MVVVLFRLNSWSWEYRERRLEAKTMLLLQGSFSRFQKAQLENFDLVVAMKRPHFIIN